MSDFIWGMIIAALLTFCGLGLFALGFQGGQASVVQDCNYYGKHALSGTQELLCSAVVEPQKLMPTPYTPYTQEEKDSTRKQRK